MLTGLADTGRYAFDAASCPLRSRRRCLDRLRPDCGSPRGASNLDRRTIDQRVDLDHRNRIDCDDRACIERAWVERGVVNDRGCADRGTGVATDSVTNLNALADKKGFVVVAPDGVDKNWNDGRTDVREGAAFTENIDDVGFLVAVIDEVAAHVRVDQARVYSMGISNGAMMSNRLACDRPDRFAAVGLVAGTGPADLAARCTSSAPAAVIAFNGTDDPLISYTGDADLHPELGRRLSVDELASYWTARNGTVGEPVTEHVTSTVARRTWSGGKSDVVFYKVQGAGHTWPGGRQYLPEGIIGSTDSSVNATELMWEFFKAHPRR
jgi:polyhydroxybutyrate depolymerase